MRYLPLTGGLLVLSLLSCAGPPGPFGPQGPAGPPGPQGPAGAVGGADGGSAIRFDLPANETTTSIGTTFSTVPKTRIINLRDQAQLPASARAAYIEVAACKTSASGGNGYIEFATPGLNAKQLLEVTRACAKLMEEADVWVPVAPDANLTVEAWESAFGSSVSFSLRVRVLAWSE